MKNHSATEENYLKAIFKYSEGSQLVTTTTLARTLETTPASVTDMVKKLHDKRLVEHVPYQGVRLTSAGRSIALAIIRKHRLWEVFLVKVLKFSWDQIHDTAEQLEHIESAELIDKLDEFLGFPQFDPHGDPIPTKSGEILSRTTQSLSQLEAGNTAVMAGILDHTDEFLRYLDRIGLTIGREIRVVERIPYDQSIVVSLEGREVVLNGETARLILVLSK